MSATILACLNNVSKFSGIPIKNLSFNNEKMPTCTLNNKTITGFVNIIINIVDNSKKDLFGKNLEQKCEVWQWLEYCMMYATCIQNIQSGNQILQEINDFMETRTYFIGYQLTIADVVIYYMLQELMGKLTYHQKEKYLNVSRWFDNIQQNSAIRSKNTVVDFSTLFLTSIYVR